MHAAADAAADDAAAADTDAAAAVHPHKLHT